MTDAATQARTAPCTGATGGIGRAIAYLVSPGAGVRAGRRHHSRPRKPLIEDLPGLCYWKGRNIMTALHTTDPSGAMQTAKAFIVALKAGDRDGARACLTPDVVFVNGSVATVHGADATLDSVLPLVDQMDEVDWPIVAEGSGPGTAFLERVDRFCEGHRWAEIKVMGVFEVGGDGRITAWRHYFDEPSGPRALASLTDRSS